MPHRDPWMPPERDDDSGETAVSCRERTRKELDELHDRASWLDGIAGDFDCD